MDEVRELLNEIRLRFNDLHNDLKDHETRLRILERIAWILLGAVVLRGGIDWAKLLKGP